MESFFSPQRSAPDSQECPARSLHGLRGVKTNAIQADEVTVLLRCREAVELNRHSEGIKGKSLQVYRDFYLAGR